MLIELICCTLEGCLPQASYQVSEKRQIRIELPDGPCVLDLKPFVKIFNGKPLTLCDTAQCYSVPDPSKPGAKTPPAMKFEDHISY